MQYYRYYHDIAQALRLIDKAVISNLNISLSDLASQLNLSEDTLQRAFTGLVGISPKRYYQFKMMQIATPLVAESSSNLDLSLDLGLSSPSRLNDLFVNVVAMTPSEFASKGEGMQLNYGVGETPFGECELVWSERGIVGLRFIVDEDEAIVTRWQAQWPHATFKNSNIEAQRWLERIFGNVNHQKPLSVWLKGTNFQLNVWRALLQIPLGKTTTYQQIAHQIDNERAVRAVGTAIGANPIAYIIPCHRVIRSDSGLGGYRWGLDIKEILLANEFSIQSSELNRSK